MTEVDTYSTLYRNNSGLTGEQWQKLQTYIDDLEAGLEHTAEELPEVKEPDDRLPQITESWFKPWVGSGSIQVT